MKKIWWKSSVIYQIYPRSFKDSNGDGIGDLEGIIEKLDYLAELGVDVIWLGPVYQSPNDDNGYDISDYYQIHPEFGTMDTFDRLLRGLHQRGMKLLMDLVVNHTSDEHAWFEASRKDTTNPHRDFYFWREGKNGGPPNNWRSFFGGSAWEYDATTDAYYLHIFSKKQPDLNWENPRVRQEVYNIIRFWLDKGVDGFRMDVIPLISKRLDFADAHLPTFNDVVEQVYSNGPSVHEYIQEMYREVLKDYDIMTVGEGPGISKSVGLDYVDEDRKELNMIFHLDHMFLGYGPDGRFDPVPFGLQEIKQIINDWDAAMGEKGWISVFMDNHDFPRMVSRFGNDQTYRVESAKLLALLILTLRGTPCIYQGSEIGMTNIRLRDISECRDVETHNFYREYTAKGMDEGAFIELANTYGRDNARTPMQWDQNSNAGFSEGQPWIKVNPNYTDINVASEMNRADGIYSFYKKLLQLRKNMPVLVYGTYREIPQEQPDLFVYERKDDAATCYVALNFSDHPRAFQLPDNPEQVRLLLGNYPEGPTDLLRPWEARLYQQ